MLYCVLMPHFCTYTEYLFAHDQSRMRKMQSGERIMRISLSALLGRDKFVGVGVQPHGVILIRPLTLL